MTEIEESMHILRDTLSGTLDKWRVLLTDFQSVKEMELEFDLQFGGRHAENYVQLVEELQEVSAVALDDVQQTVELPDTLTASIIAMDRINDILTRALAERTLLQEATNRALQDMANQPA